jgi:flagellar hook-associated protein 3 FlgL
VKDMKISTAQFFRENAGAMSRGQSEVASLQAKLGSGAQLTSPSDNSAKANLISRLQSSLERQEVYQKNIEVAKTRLTSEETALTSITQVFQRASEIAILGANGTMAKEDRAVFGIEVEELRKELLRLANSQDVNGDYIFSGNSIDSPPFVEDGSGNVSYVGDHGRLKVSVSDTRSVAINTLGNELLGSDEFSAIKVLEQGLKSNDQSIIQESITELKVASDQISVSFGRMAGRFASLNNQTALLEDTSLRIEQILSKNKDLDYAKAVTELSQESLALQALQASFTRISQLSLFNFLR